jgi:hypothetical protein
MLSPFALSRGAFAVLHDDVRLALRRGGKGLCSAGRDVGQVAVDLKDVSDVLSEADISVIDDKRTRGVVDPAFLANERPRDADGANEGLSPVCLDAS